MPDTSFCLMATLHVAAEHADAFAEGMAELVRGSRAEPGCLEYSAHRADDDPTVFIVWERWSDRAALEAHFQTPHFLAFGAAHGGSLLHPVEQGLRFLTRI